MRGVYTIYTMMMMVVVHVLSILKKQFPFLMETNYQSGFAGEKRRFCWNEECEDSVIFPYVNITYTYVPKNLKLSLLIFTCSLEHSHWYNKMLTWDAKLLCFVRFSFSFQLQQWWMDTKKDERKNASQSSSARYIAVAIMKRLQNKPKTMNYKT